MNIFWGFVEIFVKIQMWYFISKIAYDSAISANDWWVIWILKKWFGLSTNAWLRVSLKPFSFGALHPLTHAKQFKLSLGFYSSPMDSADNSMHSITLPQRNSNFCVLLGCRRVHGRDFCIGCEWYLKERYLPLLSWLRCCTTTCNVGKPPTINPKRIICRN